MGTASATTIATWSPPLAELLRHASATQLRQFVTEILTIAAARVPRVAEVEQTVDQLSQYTAFSPEFSERLGLLARQLDEAREREGILDKDADGCFQQARLVYAALEATKGINLDSVYEILYEISNIYENLDDFLVTALNSLQLIRAKDDQLERLSVSRTVCKSQVAGGASDSPSNENVRLALLTTGRITGLRLASQLHRWWSFWKSRRVRRGMLPDDVRAILGPPNSVIKGGRQQIWFYPSYQGADFVEGLAIAFESGEVCQRFWRIEPIKRETD